MKERTHCHECGGPLLFRQLQQSVLHVPKALCPNCNITFNEGLFEYMSVGSWPASDDDVSLFEEVPFGFQAVLR